MILAAAYIRVSTEEQGEHSPAAQLAEIKAFAQKKGYHIPEEWIFIDEGISGRKAENRPAFQRMIRLARRKNSGLQYILVHKHDRFARSREDAVLYKAMLKKNGVKLVSIKEPTPEDDKFAVIYESMLEAMAEYYSLNLAEEVHKTMRRKAESGEWQTTAPFGYRNEGKGLVIAADEAEAVRRLFQQYAAGVPLISLARSLNKMGFRTHQGNAFESRTVRYILHNPVYCGYLRWTPGGRADRDYFLPAAITAKGRWEAVVSPELWEAAAQRLQSERKPQARMTGKETHWLSGMVRCSACGQCLAFGVRYKSGAWQMQCSGYNHGHCHISHAISTARLIPALLSALGKMGKAEQPYAVRQKTREPEQILLEKARLRLRKAKDAYLNGIDTMEEYREIKARIVAEIAELEKTAALSNQENAAAEISALFEQGLAGFFRSGACTAEEKRLALRSILDEVVFEKQTGCLRVVFILEEPC